MFFSVIAAYVVATAFAFCGVVGVSHCIMEAQRDMGYTNFIESVAVAMWPLGVAMALILLIQIACKVERWQLLWTMSQAQSPAPARQEPAPPAKPGLPPTKPGTAPAKQGSSVPPPPPVAAATPFSNHLAAVTPPVIKEEPAEHTPSPDPIPGLPIPPPPPLAPASKPDAAQDGLNFFKLD